MIDVAMADWKHTKISKKISAVLPISPYNCVWFNLLIVGVSPREVRFNQRLQGGLIPTYIPAIIIDHRAE